MLTYRTNAENAENYLQVYVLNYDRRAGVWDLIHPAGGIRVSTGALLPPPGVASGTPRISITTTVTIPAAAGYASPIYFLPAPYWPARVHVAGSWRESANTLMIYSGDPGASGLHYTVTSGEVDPAAAALAAPQHVPAPSRAPTLVFKSALTPRLTKIAQRVTRGKDSAFDKAVALERWFLSSRFSYSLQSALPNTPQGLLNFLTTVRQGYCQQFAFAMAVLARLIGIPSRVAIGYTAGQQRQNGTWLVTTADAHAWPELYFDGVGWLRFEPTPSGAGGQATAVEPSYVAAAIAGGGTTKGHPGSSGTGSSSPSPRATGNLAHHVQVPRTGDVPLGAPGQRHGVGAPVGIIVLAVLALAGAAPGTARVITRRRRWRRGERRCRTRPGRLGRAVCRPGRLRAAMPGERVAAGSGQAGMSVSGIDEQAGQAIARIATVVERARYAPAPASAGTIRADVSVVHRALARSASRTVRWRARLLPASTLQPLQASIRQAAGLLTGWMPAAGES